MSLHNKFLNLMIENNINPKIINLDNVKYFDKETIEYIINLRLVGYQLQALIYLISIGYFEDIDEKKYYKIIRDIKKIKTLEDENIICSNLIEKQKIMKLN